MNKECREFGRNKCETVACESERVCMCVWVCGAEKTVKIIHVHGWNHAECATSHRFIFFRFDWISYFLFIFLVLFPLSPCSFKWIMICGRMESKRIAKVRCDCHLQQLSGTDSHRTIQFGIICRMKFTKRGSLQFWVLPRHRGNILTGFCPRVKWKNSPFWAKPIDRWWGSV